MLSDESSSDSETGRFKGKSEKEDSYTKNANERDSNLRSTGRSRPTDNKRYQEDLGRRRDDRLPRERNRYPRYSPPRRRHSREKSPYSKKSRERHGYNYNRQSREKTKPEEHRSDSREKRHHSRSRSYRSVENKRDFKEEIKHSMSSRNRDKAEISDNSRYKSTEKFDRRVHGNHSSSPEVKGNRSEIYKPTASVHTKRSESPIIVEDKDSDGNISEEIQPGSYYSLIPTVVKENTEESSEIDSSDDEKLRAKLLNLEKELHSTKNKKHKRKHKRKSKSNKDRKDNDGTTAVEVTSTTDIEDKVQINNTVTPAETAEVVTSTQKSSQVESNEEGEILSDDDSQSQQEIDPNDLRHKLKRTGPKLETNECIDLREKMKLKADVCGPALPPHLEKSTSKSIMPNAEGPALPPHLRKVDRKIGPVIPDDKRMELAHSDCEIIPNESSDDDPIGPLPAGAEGKWSDAHRRLEERALVMKIRNMDGHSVHNSKIKSREQWMLELPEGKAKYLGLEARTFRAKEGPDMTDRSSWTDTPEEKARKKAGLEVEEDPDVVLRREARARQLATRDDDQERAVKKHKKKHKREESLLEMHERKIKKKKKKGDKDEGKKERRPFSRDVDLQVNRFDEAQKRSVIKKAQQLDSRFSRGEAKYL